jgi:hypothetical protein
MNVPDWPAGLPEDSAEPYLDEAFGELRSLIDNGMYASSLDGLRSLMPDAVGRIDAAVSVVYWFCAISRLSAEGNDYYAEQPELAKAELTSIVERLRTGFRLLESRLREASR